jgi:peptidoglycan/xylan/chitin deacetylase (PgdA/CDA1 family)
MASPVALAKHVGAWGFHWAKRLGLPGLALGHRRAAAILRFHSISDPEAARRAGIEPGICVAPRVFERQVALLARRYRCVRMDDVAEAMAGGRPLPAEAVVITFDDGYRDNYEAAYPILRKHAVPAMFYLATGCLEDGPPLWTSEVRHLVQSGCRPTVVVSTIGATLDVRTPEARDCAIRMLKKTMVALPREAREECLRELRAWSGSGGAAPRGTMLTWAQVREMRRGGMDIGAHTVTHPLLPSIPAVEAQDEIVRSRLELQERLREPVRHFSYPNPGDGIHADVAVADLVRGTGYLTAVTSRQGYVQPGDDPFLLHRVWVSPRPWALPLDIERDALRRVASRPAADRAAPDPLRGVESGGGPAPVGLDCRR